MYSENYSLTRVVRDRVYWYVIFRDKNTNKRLNKKSVEVLRKELGDFSNTAIKRKSEAIEVIDKYLEKISEKQDNRSNIKLCNYLSDFYSFEKSIYIKRQIALNNNKIGKDYAYTRKCMIDKYVIPKLDKNMNLEDVDMFLLEKVQMAIINDGFLKAGTINLITSSVIFALKEAKRLNLVKNSVISNLDTIKEKSISERGIFTDEEVKKILAYFKEKHNDKMYLAILLSLTTGMRSGEIRALEAVNVKENYIDVLYTLACKAGKKIPKGRRTRVVPCPKSITTLLVKQAINNTGLIFYNKDNNSVETHYFTYHLNKAMKEIGISDDEKEKRKLCFHTFRHMANTNLQESVDQNTLRLTIGHTTNTMTLRYTHLTSDKVNDVVKAQKNALDKFI